MLKHSLIPFLIWSIPILGFSQEPCSLTLPEAIDIAIKNNAGLQSSSLAVEQSKELIKSSIDIQRTSFYFMRDENNLPPVGDPLNIWGISQSLEFPTIYGKKKQVAEGSFLMQEQRYQLDSRKLAMEVSKSYYKIVYLQDLLIHYSALDSMLENFARTEARRYTLGETNYLEKLTVDTKRQESALRLRQTNLNLESAYSELNRWLQSENPCIISSSTLKIIEVKPLDISEHPGVQYYQQWLEKEIAGNQFEKSKLLPDLNLSYFQGRNRAEDNKIYPGFQIGLGFPLWYGAHKASINASKLRIRQVQLQSDEYKTALSARYTQLLIQLEKYQEALNFYADSGSRLTEEMMLTAKKSYRGGEIPFLQYVLVMDQALTIQVNHLMNVYQYNLTAVELNYLLE